MRVSSCGTLDADGFPALTDAIELGRELGVDLSQHRSRALSACDLGDTDLVVGFERRHLAAAVVDAGAPRARTFAAYELSELLARVEPPNDLPAAERARAAVALAHAARERSARPLRELADPIGRGRDVAAETAGEVEEQVARIAFGLFGITPRARR